MSEPCDCKAIGKITLVAFALRSALEFVAHELLLKDVYAHSWYASLWNTPEMFKARMPAMWLSHILFGGAFALIYTRGYEESKPALGQGLRYGFWIGILSASKVLIDYFVYPISCRLAAAWAATGMVECVVIGAAIALLYKPQPHSH